jgi:hypothetical protein
MLVSELITAAFIDVGFIAVGESITAAIQTDAFARLNPILDHLSAEGLVVPNQVMQSFSLLPNTPSYTLGSGGTFSTSGGLRALKVTAWRAVNGAMAKSGRVLSMPEFGEQIPLLQKQLSELNVQALTEGQIAAFPTTITAPIPSLVGADTSYPLINLRVFPAPSFAPGQIELAYLTPLVNFVTKDDTISLPQGWIVLLRSALAKDVFAQYGRAGSKDVIWDNYSRAKQALVTENAMTAPQPQPAAPQGQQ